MRIVLLHWRASEAKTTLAVLRSAGHTIAYEETFHPSLMRQWRQSPPDTFVIHLGRLPSHGREIAIALRQSPKTRHVPLVFCDGAAEKVAAIRALLPDATYCLESGLPSALGKALSTRRAEDPVAPLPIMERYANRTAVQKLGIQPSAAIRLIDPPGDITNVLGELPPDVSFMEEEDPAPAGIALCFVHSVAGLQSTLSRVRDFARTGKLWILWRKKTAPGHTGIMETLVRETGLSLGLVDYKICAVNQTWSGLLFAFKRTQGRKATRSERRSPSSPHKRRGNTGLNE